MFLQDKTKNDTMIQEQLDVIEWMIKLDKMGKMVRTCLEMTNLFYRDKLN